ncbi:hypothetical protein RJ55_03281 [Drechmeria coniospora]|nr:hypothetical protein RJ55_03281 [Drechmeria coniospora]
MSAATVTSKGARKRKLPTETPQTPSSPANAHPQGQQRKLPRLIGPHESITAELQLKHDVLVASVISSTKIRKRITQIAAHLGESAGKPRVVLLHARTAEVCKMITIVEHCKRALKEKGKAWYQYNQLFDVPDEPRKKRDVVEETVLDKEDEPSDDDDFEAMQSRFENALLPPASDRTVKSMRIFLSPQLVPELRSKDDVTEQTSET